MKSKLENAYEQLEKLCHELEEHDVRWEMEPSLLGNEIFELIDMNFPRRILERVWLGDFFVDVCVPSLGIAFYVARPCHWEESKTKLNQCKLCAEEVTRIKILGLDPFAFAMPTNQKDELKSFFKELLLMITPCDVTQEISIVRQLSEDITNKLNFLS